jgi:hypothetical protein
MLDITNALATLADAKVHCGVKSDEATHDAMLENLLSTAASMANRLTRRLLLQRANVEYYDGDGSASLYLDNYPIASSPAPIIYVSTDDPRDFTSAGNLIAAADQLIEYDTGLIRLLEGTFAKGRHTAKISYTAGYSISGATPTLPWDLRNAYLDLTRWLFERWKANRVGVTNQTVQGITTGFRSDIPEEIAAVFEAYTRPNKHRREHI